MLLFALFGSLLSFVATPQQAVASTPTCAQGGPCVIGDIGPGGGIVFYVAPTTFTQEQATIGMCREWCKYLEVAPSNWNGVDGDPAAPWAVTAFQTSDVAYILNNNTENDNASEIGKGYVYSHKIVIQNGPYHPVNNSYAAGAARGYSFGSFNDWYLPTTAELNLLYLQRQSIGLLVGGYWSSSEGGASSAWAMSSVDRTQLNYQKSNTANVRPVRAFGTAPNAISIPNVVVPGPVPGTTPVTSIASNGQYATAVAWSGSPSIFDSATVYTATVIVTPDTGFTLEGVPTDFFSVNGRTPTSVGTEVTAKILGTTGFNPVAVAVDTAGNVFTANSGTNNVTRITSNGVTTVAGPTGSSPNAIGVDGLGNVYVVNGGSNTVTRLAPSGAEYITTITLPGDSNSSPRGLAIDSIGNVYTANAAGTVWKINPAAPVGERVTNFGTTGADPKDVAVDSLGNVYTTNSGVDFVTKISRNGIVSTFGTAGVSPRGIAIDSLNNLYVANSGANTVTKITPQGSSSILGSTGATPTFIDVDLIGNVYTVNTGTNTITKISPQGASTNLGGAGFGPNNIALGSVGNVYTSAAVNRVVKLFPQNSGTFAYQFPIAPNFTLSVPSETATVGVALTGYTINSTGGEVTQYSISPAITNTPGLSFSTSTGRITGTPTTAASSRNYTITATNATGTATQAFLLTVSAPVSGPLTWTSRSAGANNSWNSVTYGSGIFVAVSSSGSGSRVMTSPDGITWTGRTAASNNSWWDVTYANGIFVAVAIGGVENYVMTSPDGITWTGRTAANNNAWRSVTHGNGIFVAVANAGSGNRVMTSPDGITWTGRSAVNDNWWKSVTYGNGLFVAVAEFGGGSRIMTSPDGITWTGRSAVNDNSWNSVTYGNGQFVAVAASGSGNRVMTSPDGISWTGRTAANQSDWISLTYGGGLFVAVASVGSGNRVMSSQDGITWTASIAANANAWWSVTYGNGLYVAVALEGSGDRLMTAEHRLVVYESPTPVPYLRTLTSPKLNLKDGKLICMPGTYNAGFTLNGIVQGSATTLFSPSSFTYNLLINGAAQISLTVTSSAATATWNLPTSNSGSLLSCSVTVSANGVTNTHKSTDNTSALSSAVTTLTTAISNADAAYTAAQSANAKAYQKALVDNRALWRKQIEAIRANYFDTLARITASEGTRKMIADKSTALKVRLAAQKKSVADYKVSQPAAAAARDAANKAALDAKNTAIAKANATYGTFIESIGYGVLIP